MKKNNLKPAFTLAEVMITLVVVGILTGILMPVAFHSAPSKNIAKFKKANATLNTVIQELIRSDKYYKDGDLGMKADGTLVKDKTYFCQTFADVISTKSVACSSFDVTTGSHAEIDIDQNQAQSWFQTIENAQSYVDRRCAEYAPEVGEEIVTPEGIVFYQAGPNITFGMTFQEVVQYTGHSSNSCLTPTTMYSECPKRNFAGPNSTPIYPTAEGLDPKYKIFCIDVDGIPSDSYYGNCKNECPFGYGIRADGKIFMGERAKQWLDKNLSDK
ncbi:type II secretion system protein [bacterium]|nr:type II secretion system protein [bacterium]